jgi:hypothetical protein
MQIKTPREEAINALLKSIVNIEHAMAVDADSWDYTDISDARDARDTVRNILHTFKAKTDDDNS